MTERAVVRDLVVIVPGILGSRLRHREKGLVWGGARTLTTLLQPSRALALTGDGLRAPDPNVSPDGLVRFALQLPGLWKIDAYTRLLGALHTQFAFDDSNLIVFAYDWRLSCAVNARLLAARIEPALSARRLQFPEARIVFVAHSLGGLVVAHFVEVLGGHADTKRVVTIGTPFRGSVKAFATIARGAPAGLPVIRSRVRDLVRTLPSVYELLPRYRAIVHGPQLRALNLADLPDDADGNLFTHATALHEAIEEPRQHAYERNVVVGSLQRTPQFATIAGSIVTLHDSWALPDGVTLDERGDGTVPRQSVAPPGWPDDADAVPLAQGHVALAGSDDLIRILHQILTARPRAEQGPQRARLALKIPDLVETGEPLDAIVEVADGDGDVPLIVDVEAVDGGAIAAPRVPVAREHGLVARFDGLRAGDYRVRVAALGRVPDVRPVWDLVTVVDPADRRLGDALYDDGRRPLQD